MPKCVEIVPEFKDKYKDLRTHLFELRVSLKDISLTKEQIEDINGEILNVRKEIAHIDYESVMEAKGGIKK